MEILILVNLAVMAMHTWADYMFWCGLFVNGLSLCVWSNNALKLSYSQTSHEEPSRHTRSFCIG